MVEFSDDIHYVCVCVCRWSATKGKIEEMWIMWIMSRFMWTRMMWSVVSLVTVWSSGGHG